METPPIREGDAPEHDDDEHNALGYRNVDEDEPHDERGSQGPGPGEEPIRET